MFTKRYKFLRSDDGQRIWSEHRNVTWEVGQWQEVVEDDLAMCYRGFHCCRDIYSAFSYVPGEVLAEVEVDGKFIADPYDDKEVWQRMRIVRAWRWKKRDSVALAIFAAELVMTNYEQAYPDDARPRQAIEAAKLWLAVEHEVAARSAESAESAAWSAVEFAARSAGSAAESAARSAGSAARYAAESAARSAGSAAWSAARSAGSAAWSAARSTGSATWSAGSAAIQRIARWMDDHLAELEEIPAQKAKEELHDEQTL